MIDDYRDKPAKCGQHIEWRPPFPCDTPDYDQEYRTMPIRTHEEFVEPDKRWLGAVLCGLSAVVTICICAIAWGIWG